MALTGGTLSTKMIELVGDLNVEATIKNINRSVREIEKDLEKRGTKVKLNVELFGKVKDISKDISELQKKLDASPSIGSIKLGVELKDTTIKSINEQIRGVQTKVDGSSVNKLKLEVDFDFQGSASKVKQEMQEISAFVDRYSKELNSTKILDLSDDAQNVSADVDRMVKSIGGLDRGTSQVSDSIEGQLRKLTGSSGKFAVTFGQDIDGSINKATASLTDADGTVKKFSYSLDDNTKKLSLQSRTTKEAGDQQERLSATMTKVEEAQRKLNTAVSKAPQGLNQELVEQAENHLRVARSMEEQGRVTNEGVDALTKLEQGIKEINAESSKLKIAEEFREISDATRKSVQEFEALGGSQEDINKFNRAMENMTDNSVDGMKELQAEVKEATNEIVTASNRIDSALSSMDQKKLANAIDERDIASIKRYVEEIYDAEVATIQLTEKNDKLGNSVDRLKINMQEQNGVVKTYTTDMSRGLDGTARSLTQVDESTKTLSKSNSLLGNTFGDIVGRVTQYVGVIEVLQGAMRLVRQTVTEIMDINAQMTELGRVADPSINLDILLERSVSLAKELGASVEEVVGSVAEMARTFGEFNESQLIAMTRTATIMDNVSDLSLAQSTETLVGAMNAFNITAEDSIGIVDSLNEVDIVSLPAQRCA